MSVSFVETNLVPNAGLLPAAMTAQRIGLADLVDGRLKLPRHGANSGAMALSVIGLMLAGGDSIDDVAVLRAGASGSLFDGARAPSTVGSWLRAHNPSNVRQLDEISRELLGVYGVHGGKEGLLLAVVEDAVARHQPAERSQDIDQLPPEVVLTGFLSGLVDGLLLPDTAGLLRVVAAICPRTPARGLRVFGAHTGAGAGQLAVAPETWCFASRDALPQRGTAA